MGTPKAIIITGTVVVLAIYGLDHGIFVGSSSRTEDRIVHKTCRYAFITGIVERPALGNSTFGLRGINDADNLYCRIFAY